MRTYVKKGDKIKGERIQCEARKISNPVPIPKSGRHKTQQIVIRNNAESLNIDKRDEYTQC